MAVKSNFEEILNSFVQDADRALFVSRGERCSLPDLRVAVDRWKKQGFRIVFTAGVFDIFTINHLLAIYHYKEYLIDNAKLVISIDTDKRVLQSKGFSAEKGGSIKPILSWNSRALMVTRQYSPGRVSLGSY